MVDFHVGTEEAVKDTVPYLDRTLDEEISAPVRASQTGLASLLRATMTRRSTRPRWPS